MPAITLDELARLIKLLGMLGSSSDGEVVAAARFAAKWVAEHGTSWEALLVPEAEVGVSGVVAGGAAEAERLAVEERVKAAFKDGFRQGIERMAAQVKAQGQMGAGAQTGLGAAWTGPGGLGQQTTQTVRNAPQQPPGGLGGAAAGGPSHTSWRAVAQDLLNRDAQGIPGVFRGPREATFVQDILGRSFFTLTPAQETWLRDIAGRSAMSW